METTLVRAADMPPTDPETGARLIREQRQALVAEVEHLGPEQWRSPTICDRWTVHDIVAHVTAAAEDQAQPRRAVAGMIRGRFRYPGESTLDALNEVGIDRRRDLAPERLVADLRRLAETSRTPAWFRRVPLGGGNGLPSDTTGAYLGHVIYVRDTWMHRHDVAHAVGATIAPEPEAAEIVAQVVRDLGRFWSGPDLVLTLTGPEGGSWLIGAGPATASTPVATLPAVDFMWRLSGRPSDDAMIAEVPDAVRPALTDARVTF